MFSTLRTRFGIPGVISVMALVFAMLGGAYAANNSASGGKATASAKAKKGPRGPRGPKGDTGPAGPQGPAGANGKDGSNGANGAAGTDGVSPTGTEFSGGKSGHCENLGGVEFKGANVTYACNGQKGTNGKPWAPESELPSEATETGAWSLEHHFECDVATAETSHECVPSLSGSSAKTAISFTVPLAEALPKTNVHLILKNGKEFTETFEEVDPTVAGVCTGSLAAPTAAPGHFCLYSASDLKSLKDPTYPLGIFLGSGNGLSNPATGEPGAGASGVLVLAQAEGKATVDAHGTWAVTAE